MKYPNLWNPYLFRQQLLLALSPWRGQLEAMSHLNPVAYAFYKILEPSITDRRKPTFGITSVKVGDQPERVDEVSILRQPFCTLLHFQKRKEVSDRQPVVLIVAPLSGHHSTLLRDTVRTMLPDFDVYITDWADARNIPLERGDFGLDDYIDYLREFYHVLAGKRPFHVVAVCQPGVPALIACALESARAKGLSRALPKTLTIMSAPIDTRIAPTIVNEHANKKSMKDFERVLQEVPPMYEGVGRMVCPGYVQHGSFVGMNLDDHMRAHAKHYFNMLRGDQDPKHVDFYNEYNSYLDMAGTYFLDTIRLVFKEHALANGTWDVRGERVDLGAIKRVALLTIGGVDDDIVSPEQTHCTHDLCTQIPKRLRKKFTAPCGHYGIFSGSKWRDHIYPEVRKFINKFA